MAQVIEVRAQEPRPNTLYLALVEFPGAHGLPVRSWIVDRMQGGKWYQLGGMLRARPEAAGARITHYSELPPGEAMTDAALILPRVAEWVLTLCGRPGDDKPIGYMVDRWMGGPEPFDVLAQFKRAGRHQGYSVVRWAPLPAQPILAGVH